ncbi:hypothetical protein SNEBB_010734 [Seison nebaliae]|nr:hypothetical protein SNEBB_010734 [Seison nebaliae]
MTSVELYTKGARIWLPDGDSVWVGAELLDNYAENQTKYRAKVDDGDLIEINIQPNLMPPMRNPQILTAQNDLTSLSYLNEPEVLYNIQLRFQSSQIYTYCGIILVALNPYAALPIYGNEVIEAYSGNDTRDFDPHIFAVAEEALQQVRTYQKNQSIIVSGESGAGKTVSAKYAMRYFANEGGSSEETQIEKRVLASNPIMEAFGNAKTTRNDNSSRFGKYIEINFDKKYRIVGANMKTYLLEKSRVVYQSGNERNYHIFYQLLTQRMEVDMEILSLDEPSKYRYLNQGNCLTVESIDDGLRFQEMYEAFQILGIDEQNINTAFRLLASILHLGNVKFSSRDSESCYVEDGNVEIQLISQLLHIDGKELSKWLCEKRLETVGETLQIKLKKNETEHGRDALAKHLYSKLFDWIVNEVNNSFHSKERHKFIGVLDIYGFETFPTNSFEQFCINYANEKLQQQFNRHVFKLEQEEYKLEEIKWAYIDFYDNQPCIDMIEGRLGILGLLDEECLMPRGNDMSWCEKLYKKFLNTSHFDKPKIGRQHFTISHFAEHVKYDCRGFLEKNRDTVLHQQIDVIRTSQLDLIELLFADEIPSMNQDRKSKLKRKRTVGNQFKESLNLLMEALDSTNPHYIRCIKPNDEKAAFKIDRRRVVEQLRACGVLETVRISAAGFPSRWSYSEFFQRYRLLLTQKTEMGEKIKRRRQSSVTLRMFHKTMSEDIIKRIIPDEEKYQFGKTKIFFRAGQVAFMEKLRSEKMYKSCILIQKTIRGFLARRKYEKIRNFLKILLNQSRGYLARKHLKKIRLDISVLRIQSFYLTYVQCRNHRRLNMFAILLQRQCRGYLCRKNYEDKRLRQSLNTISSFILTMKCQENYKKALNGIVLLQSHYRRRVAKKELRKRKSEMRNVQHVQSLNKGLENKIIERQQKISLLEEKLKDSSRNVSILHNEKNELDNRLSKITLSLQHQGKEKLTLEDKLKELEEENEMLKKKNWEMEEGMKKTKEEYETQIELISADNERLKYLEHHPEVSNRRRSTIRRLSEVKTNELTKVEIDQTLNEENEMEKNEEMNLIDFDDNSNISKETYLSIILRQQSFLQQRKEEIDQLKDEKSQLANGQLNDSINLNDYDLSSNQSFIIHQLIQLDNQNEHIKEIEKEVGKLNNLLITKDTDTIFKSIIQDNKRLTQAIDLLKNEMGIMRTALVLYQQQENKELTRIEGMPKEEHNPLQSPQSDNELVVAYKTSKFLNRNDDFHSLSMEEKHMNKLLEMQNQKRNEDLENQLLELRKKLKDEQKLKKRFETDIMNYQNASQVTTATVNLTLENRVIVLTEHTNELMEENSRLREELKLWMRLFKHITTTYYHDSKVLLRNSDGVPDQRLEKVSKELNFGHMLTKFQETITALTEKKTKEVEYYRDIIYNSSPENEQFKKYGAMSEEISRQSMFELDMNNTRTIIDEFTIKYPIDLSVNLNKEENLKFKEFPYIAMFMCVRYLDSLENEENMNTYFTMIFEKIRTLCSNIHNNDKDLDKKINRTVFIFAIYERFTNLLKQFGSEKYLASSPEDDYLQHYMLQSFEYNEYFLLLRKHLTVALTRLLNVLFQKLYEWVRDLCCNKKSEVNGTKNDNDKIDGFGQIALSPMDNVDPPETRNILEQLKQYYKMMRDHNLHEDTIALIFQRLYLCINSSIIRTILLVGSVSLEKGFAIKYLLDQLRTFAKDHHLSNNQIFDVEENLAAANELSLIIFVHEDVKKIVETAKHINAFQVKRILEKYKGCEEHDKNIKASFIESVMSAMKFKQTGSDETLTTPVKSIIYEEITFSYFSCRVHLEDVEIPKQFRDLLRRKI